VKPVPIWWFFAILVGALALAGHGFVVNQQHIEKMNEFMARGGRFTADDGRVLAARIEAIEKQLQAGKNE